MPQRQRPRTSRPRPPMIPPEPRRMLQTIAEQFARHAARTGFGAVPPDVLQAMADVPRQRFVPADAARRAYDDAALSLASGQTISQPFVVALMTALLRPEPEHRVLEVGTGSGYQAAVLAELVREVYTLEVLPELADTATERLRMLGYTNVHVRTADGAKGWPEHAPYDGILVACGSESVPPALLEQLAPHGHLVIPVGPHDDQRLLDVTVDPHGAVHTKDVLGVRFVPLVHLIEPRHERFEDPRGIGLRAIAATEADAYAELALALAALVTDPTDVAPQRRVEFACSAASGPQLLARWLDEVVWAMQRQEMVFTSFDVRLRGDSLRAAGLGEPRSTTPPVTADPRRMTLLDPTVAACDEGWRASCVVSGAH